MHTLQYGLLNLLTIIIRNIFLETKEDKITGKAGLNPLSLVFRYSINSYAILILAVVQYNIIFKIVFKVEKTMYIKQLSR